MGFKSEARDWGWNLQASLLLDRLPDKERRMLNQFDTSQQRANRAMTQASRVCATRRTGPACTQAQPLPVRLSRNIIFKHAASKGVWHALHRALTTQVQPTRIPHHQIAIPILEKTWTYCQVYRKNNNSTSSVGWAIGKSNLMLGCKLDPKMDVAHSEDGATTETMPDQHVNVWRVLHSSSRKTTWTTRPGFYQNQQPHRPSPSTQKVRPRKVPFQHAPTTGWCLYKFPNTSHSARRHRHDHIPKYVATRHEQNVRSPQRIVTSRIQPCSWRLLVSSSCSCSILKAIRRPTSWCLWTKHRLRHDAGEVPIARDFAHCQKPLYPCSSANMRNSLCVMRPEPRRAVVDFADDESTGSFTEVLTAHIQLTTSRFNMRTLQHLHNISHLPARLGVNTTPAVQVSRGQFPPCGKCKGIRSCLTTVWWRLIVQDTWANDNMTTSEEVRTIGAGVQEQFWQEDKQMTAGRINRSGSCVELLTLSLESGRVSAEIHLPFKHFCHSWQHVKTALRAVS